MANRMVRIAAGCSLDTSLALLQVANYGEADYLILDYLMEHGMAKMAAVREADPTGGFAAGFLTPEIFHELPRLLACGTKIIASAGGLNPVHSAELFAQRAAELGLFPKIAVVHGDDVLSLTGSTRVDMFSGQDLPEELSSGNAYLGAAPIVAALRTNPDVVITGRVVDSALTLGPLLHEFGWATDDYDLLATGSLVGHLLECGAQTSGGTYTDWREADFVNPAFPLAEVHADGSVVMTKVPGGNGRISIGTIAEQLTYEIGDPQRYFLPDVTLDSSQVTLEEIGQERIRLSGAKGYPPTSTYKVCCIEHVGWRGVLSGVTVGKDAIEKARKTIEAVTVRAEAFNRRYNWEPFDSISAQVIGSGESLGSQAPPINPQEAVYRLVADHPRQDAVEGLVRMHGASFVSMAPGTCFLGAEIRPRMKVWSYLLEKDRVTPKVTAGGVTISVETPVHRGFEDAMVNANPPLVILNAPGGVEVPLEYVAYTRAGDKGGMANVGVIARELKFLPYIAHALTEEAVAEWYRHLFADRSQGQVERFEMPGIGALNFLLHDALDGGAVTSRRFDDMGKSLGQQLLHFPVRLPAKMLA